MAPSPRAHWYLPGFVGTPDREQGMTYPEDDPWFAGQKIGANTSVKDAVSWRDGFGLSGQNEKLDSAP